MKLALYAGAALATVTLAACGSTPPPPQVASLATSNATATSTPSTSDDSKRPQLRLDSSDDDVNAVWKAYYACLKDNGHKMLTGRGDEHAGVYDPSGTSPDMNDDSPPSVAARKACKDKLPLQPPELDQSRNPHYLDQYHAYMTCLTSHDLAVHATDPFGSGWTYDDGVTQKLSESQQRQVDHDCQLSSFKLG
ncbi:hypothetical protein [Kutzneria kofuensis]|jgi:hypothetical protein|uniref:Uncharacterized protein n=1 Tax=Kutzneria kofuensis TaxID=103725 RepID=A0A7W9KDH2_9PSEU|nr:hypothetical protein [Kutzneria kofuensis]MBB5890521.1 hypothetical protein [Kutzneria kofuensis]